MAPAAGINPLRVGPEDVSASEAGELVGKVGIAGQAKGLQQAMAKQMPPSLRTACARYEHVERSKHLDRGEVEKQARETVGDNLEKVLGARVRGSKSNPLDSNVVILYLTDKGRTARCFVSYSEFPKSQAAFDKALASGEVAKSPIEDPEALREQNERLQAEAEQLARRLEKVERTGPNLQTPSAKTGEGEGGGEGGDGGDAGSAEVPEGTAKELIAKMGDYSDAQVAALAKDDRKTVAKAAKAEQKNRK